MTDWTTSTRESNGVNEPAHRRAKSTESNEAFLGELRALIEREAKRASVSPWFAQACLVNGVDPLVHRRRAAA